MKRRWIALALLGVVALVSLQVWEGNRPSIVAEQSGQPVAVIEVVRQRQGPGGSGLLAAAYDEEKQLEVVFRLPYQLPANFKTGVEYIRLQRTRAYIQGPDHDLYPLDLRPSQDRRKAVVTLPPFYGVRPSTVEVLVRCDGYPDSRFEIRLPPQRQALPPICTSLDIAGAHMEARGFRMRASDGFAQPRLGAAIKVTSQPSSIERFWLVNYTVAPVFKNGRGSVICSTPPLQAGVTIALSERNPFAGLSDRVLVYGEVAVKQKNGLVVKQPFRLVPRVYETPMPTKYGDAWTISDDLWPDTRRPILARS